MNIFFNKLGNKILKFFDSFGDASILLFKSITLIFSRSFHFKNLIEQIYRNGVESLTGVLLTSLSVGMVFAVQVALEFTKFGAGNMLGGVVGFALLRELAPILTGVVVAGRVGSSIAAEIGTMKVTEQIDALETMAVSPQAYLVAPRVLALIIAMPALVIFADFIGVFGGFIIAVYYANINPNVFIGSMYQMLSNIDILGGIIKAVFFGIIIATTSCYQGLNTSKGALGVGKATTNSVIISLISIFIANYFLSLIIFGR